MMLLPGTREVFCGICAQRVCVCGAHTPPDAVARAVARLGTQKLEYLLLLLRGGA